jgi:hypothetical protein
MMTVYICLAVFSFFMGILVGMRVERLCSACDAEVEPKAR